MVAKKIIFIVLIVAIIGGCGIKFKTYEEFRNADEKKRIEQIKKTLKNYNLKNYNKFTLIYIDHMLTTTDFYKILERQFPDPQFKNFLKKAVLTLYYSYEPDNLKLSPDKWFEETKIFLINLLEYPYSHGEEKYYELLKEDIETRTHDLFFCFYRLDSKEPEELARGKEFAFTKYILIPFYWISEKYTFSDFKQLNTLEQAHVLRGHAYMGLINQGIPNAEGTNDYLDSLFKEWEDNSEFYLSMTSIKELSDDIPFRNFAKIIIEDMF